MNWKQLFALLLAVAGLAAKLSAQGTAFMYQGRLNDNGSAATGAYDLRFALYDAATNGNAISFPQTNSATGVTGGLFTATLDFGPVFSGTNYWLSIGVRTNGNTNAFTLLWPRQPLLPVPYAIFANSASNLLGTLPANRLTGTLPASAFAGYTNTVALTNAGNLFNGSFNGVFSGNGTNLLNLNASQLTGGTIADARLTPNVALLDHNQTFTGANNFTSINTFTNRGNYFVGSFFGNGLVGWIPVSGTYTQAMVDAGYLLTNPGLTTMQLPPAGQLTVGDIVRISGAGAGGWLVAENSGQSILGNFASYRNSFLVALPNTGDYHGVAASTDGTRMYAVGNFTGVYASSDSGHTWSPVGNLSGSWYSIACSANGKIIFAEPSGAGTIWKSTDSGLTWANTGSSATGSSIACTADGSLVFTANIACSGNGTYLAKLVGGGISVSTNAGSSWFGITAPSANLSCLAVSSDCTRLVAGGTNGLLYASANRGATWTLITTTNQFWSGAWMSADGSKFAATVSTIGSISGGIYYSSTSAQPNTISTNSTICGSQGSAVELQYIGNGKFMPVSSAGLLWAN
jgi:hypothetical protein